MRTWRVGKWMTGMNNFAIFILTHGRPKSVATLKTLRRCGYTGRVVFVLDNEDKTLPEYEKLYGKENIVVFDKLGISKEFDTGDNFDDRRAIVYARNACFDIARRLGLAYFMQMDDDYSTLQFRFDEKGAYKYVIMRNADRVLRLMLAFYKKIPCLSVAMAQGGDYIGGAGGSTALAGPGAKRKCMNSFLCSVERPFQFVGRVNEDVNTYTSKAATGGLFLTLTAVSLVQKQTQANKGGMTEMYLDSGTYVKSFYSVMYHPSGVKIRVMHTEHARIHHCVSWDYTAPKIIGEKWKR